MSQVQPNGAVLLGSDDLGFGGDTGMQYSDCLGFGAAVDDEVDFDLDEAKDLEFTPF